MFQVMWVIWVAMTCLFISLKGWHHRHHSYRHDLKINGWHSTHHSVRKKASQIKRQLLLSYIYLKVVRRVRKYSKIFKIFQNYSSDVWTEVPLSEAEASLNKIEYLSCNLVSKDPDWCMKIVKLAIFCSLLG